VSRRRAAPRHRSREVALQVLFAADLQRGPRSGEPLPALACFEGVAASFDLPEGARAFAKELVAGTAEHAAELDALIAEHARNWRISRMATVDRNILRLAAFELAHGATPTSVVIDEAIELAHRFGSDASPAFVNGVLDALARAVRAPEPRTEGPAA
jgi:N utilization substance protein B